MNTESLLAADVVQLEHERARLEQELRIAREMLSETLDIANQAIAYIVEHTL
jgi:hypothetical protein